MKPHRVIARLVMKSPVKTAQLAVIKKEKKERKIVSMSTSKEN